MIVAMTLAIAVASAPISPEAIYNEGVAQYRSGDHAAAAESFERVAANDINDELLARSAYNLGNTVFQSAMEGVEGADTGQVTQEAIDGLDGAQDMLRGAIGRYRDAIRANPRDDDARANGQLAWRMLQQLKQMQDQMKEQQDQHQSGEQGEQQQDQQQSGEQGEQQQDQHQSGEQGEQQQDQQQPGEQGEQQQDQQQSGEQGEQQQDQQQSGEQGEQQQDQQQTGEQREQQQQQRHTRDHSQP
ncbi:MAG: hypothetical protein QGH76_07735, partial [Phycisphaerales bacterium]|nr:hypothetical protein [Phycisphaerales bacterium]